MTPPKNVLGANIARERKRQCQSMRSLAKAADMHGSEISRLEHGQRDPRLWTIVKVARALGMTPSDLLRKVE